MASVFRYNGPVLNSLLVYTALQIGDLITTLIFLSYGVAEGNPFVRLAIETIGAVPGLVVVKLIALVVGFVAFKSYARLLYKINFAFALIIVWNLVAISRA